MRNRLHRQKGVSLILVMWALFVMSFAIMGLIQLLNLNITGASAMQRVSLVMDAAHGGVVVGKLPEFPINGEEYTIPSDEYTTVRVSAESETGRFNINHILQIEDHETLARLFRRWGLSTTETETVIDCLLDYVEPGDLRRINGAKRQQYQAAGRPNLPTGRPFQSVQEMTQVLNIELLTNRQPDWRNYFTVYGDGKLDLSSAHPDLMRALLNVGDPGIRALVRLRSESAPDEKPLPDLQAARLALGLTEKEFEEVQSQVTVNSPYRRVYSRATMGHIERKIEGIFDLRNANQVKTLSWDEW